VSPTLSNVRAGHGICRYCNSSFPFDGEAEVYLVADANALKIGCAAFGGDRVNQHLRMGWTEMWRIKTETGDAAYALEHGVLAWWRESLRAPAHYTSKQMPQWGATETVAWDTVQPRATLSRALDLADEWGLNVEVSIVMGDDVRPLSLATNVGPRARRRAAKVAATPVALWVDTELERESIMSTNGPHWSQAMNVVRHQPRSIPRGGIPTSPGVYIWFRDGDPVYVGEAKSAHGLRGRLRAHLSTGPDLSRSTLRASVAAAQLGVTRSYARQRPSVMTTLEIVCTNDWLTGCEIGWIECSSPAAAQELEVNLRREWTPPLNIL
jgi:hypothetical protein